MNVLIDQLRKWLEDYDFRRLSDEDPLSEDVDFGDTLLGIVRALVDSPMSETFGVVTEEDETLHVTVKIVDEGVIVDLENDDEVLATWAATAQELADDYCH